jgi:hypothetical protein
MNGKAVAQALTLALVAGIAAATSSLIRVAFRAPTAALRPEQVLVVTTSPGGHQLRGGLTGHDIETVAGLSSLISSVAGVGVKQGDRVITVDGDSFTARTTLVSPHYFSTLGEPLKIGRAFTTAGEGVVISETFWRTRFGSRPDIVGLPVIRDGIAARPVSILGVARDEAAITGATDIWSPVSPATFQNSASLVAVARLRDAQFATAKAAVIAALAGTRSDVAIQVTTLAEHVAAARRVPLLAAGGVAVFLLVLGIANCVHLTAADGLASRRTLWVMSALGASRVRLRGMALTRSAYIAGFGLTGALLIALGLLKILNHAAPAELVPAAGVGLHPRDLSMAMLLMTMVAILLGAVWLWQAAPFGTAASLVHGRAGDDRATIARIAVVSSQWAATLVFAVAAWGAAQGLVRFEQWQPGIDVDHLTAVRFRYPVMLGNRNSAAYPYARFARDSSELAQAVHRKLTASAVTFADAAPLVGRPSSARLTAEFRPGEERTVDLHRVGPDYAHVLGTPILAGRAIDSSDRLSDAALDRAGSSAESGVIVLSDSVATSLFASPIAAIGQKVRLEDDFVRERRVVGVLADIRTTGPDQRAPNPAAYVPFRQAPLDRVELIVRSDLSADVVTSVARAAARSAGGQAVFVSGTGLLREQRQVAALALFIQSWVLAVAALAGWLGLTGTFGVVVRVVAVRRKEVAIREAMGASSIRAAWPVIQPLAAGCAIGVVIGLGIDLAICRFVPLPIVYLDQDTVSRCYVVAAPALAAAFLWPFAAVRYRRRGLADALRLEA